MAPGADLELMTDDSVIPVVVPVRIWKGVPHAAASVRRRVS